MHTIPKPWYGNVVSLDPHRFCRVASTTPPLLLLFLSCSIYDTNIPAACSGRVDTTSVLFCKSSYANSSGHSGPLPVAWHGVGRNPSPTSNRGSVYIHGGVVEDAELGDAICVGVVWGRTECFLSASFDGGLSFTLLLICL